MLIGQVTDQMERASGSVAMFYGGPILWSTKTQKAVLTLSSESEYVGHSECTKQGQWFTQLLRDMRRNKYIGPDPNMVHMLGDNMGEIALTKNPHLNDQSKHIYLSSLCA
jgi:hypothetical protein